MEGTMLIGKIGERQFIFLCGDKPTKFFAGGYRFEEISFSPEEEEGLSDFGAEVAGGLLSPEAAILTILKGRGLWQMAIPSPQGITWTNIEDFLSS
jgi:hypothetical protein